MILKIKNLSMMYDKDNLVVDDVSFSISTGQVTSLIGRNGSGKTTILKILAQILDPIAGEIYIDHINVLENPNYKTKIAYLPDSFDFFLYDNGHTIIDYYGMVYPDMDKNYVINEAKSLGIDLKVATRKLSKGNKTLLGLIIVLATGAPFLLLDEVLDGIDVLNKTKILEYILDAAEEGRGILICSHQLAELQGISDRIMYIGLDGKLVSSNRDGDEEVLHKYQIVSNSTLSDELLNKMVVKQQIGRVYTVLVSVDIDVESILDDPTIVQYDQLPVQLEDLFYWEVNNEKRI